MTRLSQFIALDEGAKSAADAAYAAAEEALRRPERLGGLERKYQPKDQENGHRYANESTKVQVTVEETLTDLNKVIRRMMDVALTKETGNSTATADLVVAGQVIARQLPVTYFLFLGRALGRLRTFVQGLPTLDLAEDWTQEGAPPGQWRSEPVVTDKTRKIPRNHVKWTPPDATYTQPAQVDTFAEDVPEGWWTLVKFNGGIPTRAKAAYLERIGLLQDAVKVGREEANAAEVSDESVGQDILAYVFG